jgi:aflatoxin B1 aldehyde reductase
MAHPQPNIIFGAAVILATIDAKETETHLKLLEELGIKDIDCAEGYGKAEDNLGKTNAAMRFNIDTKCSVAMGPDFMTKDAVLSHAKESLRKLGTKSVRVTRNDAHRNENNKICRSTSIIYMRQIAEFHLIAV